MSGMVLKIRFPAIDSNSQVHVQAVRTFRFQPSTTVREALEKLAERGGLEAAEAARYGLFVPSYGAAAASVQGWLAPHATLAELGIQAGAELDYRPRRGRKRIIWSGKLDSSVEAEWNDEASIKRNLVDVFRDFSKRKLLHVMPPSVNRRVVILNKNELLLNFPFPESSQFVLSVQEGWKYSSDCSEEEIVSNLYFFVQTPYLEGNIFKKAASGFRRGWKKSWCVLQKETLSFYDDQLSDTPVGGVHIRNVEFCYQSEPIDAQSKKLGAVFRLGTTGHDKVLYLGLAHKEELPRWINSISDWISFSEFFRPKAISERGVALSSILSGQIRPNPKTHQSDMDGAGDVIDRRSSGRQSILEDLLPQVALPGGLEVQPNREISVVLNDGSIREMVVDSRLDVYELAYMIAEEIRSENAFIISPDDFGPHRHVELLDHQSSLASQQIPLSARFCIRKTGIVDDFVRECDIYDNHFLFVTLPMVEGCLLCRDETHESGKVVWRKVQLMLYGGKLCVTDENEDVSHVVPMRAVLSIGRSETFESPLEEDVSFTMYLTDNRELHFLASTPEECEDWLDLDPWCGFRCNNMLMDPTDQYSWKLYEGGPVFDEPLSNFIAATAVSSNAGDDLLDGPPLSPTARSLSARSPAAAETVMIDNDMEDEDDVGMEDEEDTPGPAHALAGAIGDTTSPRAISGGSMESWSSSGDVVKADSHSGGSLSTSFSTSQSRIKQFDWRKGKQSVDTTTGSSPAMKRERRQSVEELFLAGESEESADDAQRAEEDDDESSAALRVPSDDEDFSVSTSLDTRTEKGTSSHAEDDSTVDPVVVAPGGARLNSRPTSGAFDHSSSSGNRKTPPPSKVLAPSTKGDATQARPNPPTATPTPIKPPQDISRLIRRAYESLEAVKLKALPDNDPSLYCWKVLHSINLQKLGYASARSSEVIFYDLRGNEVLRVLNTELPGLNVPASRLERVEKMMKQMRKSSKRDLRAELIDLYDAGDEGVMIRPARDAEFEYRVFLRSARGGEQVGWASRRGLDMRFFDVNGKLLRALPADLVGLAVMDLPGSGTAAKRVLPTDVRALFGTREQVHVVRVEGHARYDFQVLLDDATHVGYGEREAFDFAFMDLTGRVLGRMPLVAVPPALAALIEAADQEKQQAAGGGGVKKRSSSGVGTGRGSRKGNRLKPKEDSAGSLPAASAGANSSMATTPISPRSILAGTSSKPRSSSTAPSSPGSGESKLGGRRLSEWQLKLRNSGPFKPTTDAASPKLHPSKSASALGRGTVSPGGPVAPVRKLRSESVDYTPDGLSPGLEDSVKAYDPEGQHRPMGLAGLLGEPEDSDEEEGGK